MNPAEPRFSSSSQLDDKGLEIVDLVLRHNRTCDDRDRFSKFLISQYSFAFLIRQRLTVPSNPRPRAELSPG
jgi:hypothetical protein